MNSQEVVDFISQRIAKDPSGSLSRICEEVGGAGPIPLSPCWLLSFFRAARSGRRVSDAVSFSFSLLTAV